MNITLMSGMEYNQETPLLITRELDACFHFVQVNFRNQTESFFLKLLSEKAYISAGSKDLILHRLEHYLKKTETLIEKYISSPFATPPYHSLLEKLLKLELRNLIYHYHIYNIIEDYENHESSDCQKDLCFHDKALAFRYILAYYTNISLWKLPCTLNKKTETEKIEILSSLKDPITHYMFEHLIVTYQGDMKNSPLRRYYYCCTLFQRLYFNNPNITFQKGVGES